MARTNNKYTSINFNHIYDKNNLPSTTKPVPTTPLNPSSSSFYSTISSSTNLYKNPLSAHPGRSHGRMLVLTRPTPRPLPAISTPKASPLPHNSSTLEVDPLPVVSNPTSVEPKPDDRISLRPLGRTGAGSLVCSPVEAGTVSPLAVGSPKPDKFVPPHLRPGFVGKEEKPGPEVLRGKDGQRQHQQGYFGNPSRYGEDGRPKSGGYERTRRGGESDLGLMNRPRSSGTRPSSSG